MDCNLITQPNDWPQPHALDAFGLVILNPPPINVSLKSNSIPLSNELSLLLKKLVADGATILMASHDIFRVREVCNRIGILKQGSLVKELQSNEVTATELEDIYIEYMKN